MANRRVLIDGYFLHKPYGFGRYIFEICRALGTAPTAIKFIVAVPSHIDVATLPVYPNLTWQAVPDLNFVIWEQIMIPRLAHRCRCDLIHFPYNSRSLYSGGIPVVTTVHDVLFLYEPVTWLRPKIWFIHHYTVFMFKVATRRSKAVITISETSRRALKPFNIVAKVIYNAVDGFLSEVPIPANTTGRYILHRGGYSPHRNTERAILAFKQVRQKLPDLQLKIVGAPDGAQRWGTDEGSIQYLPRISDAELAGLFVSSACVVAVSLIEGFCSPIIEGFGFGAPVITSDVDPMREVAGGAARLVNPYDVDSIAAAMLIVLTNASVAQTLIERGRARMAAFKGERVAQQMIEVFTRCFGATRPAQARSAVRA